MKRSFQTKIALLIGLFVTMSIEGVVAKIGERKRRLQQMIRVSGNSGKPDPADLPLPECWGDCDNDDECGQGLICEQRGAWEQVTGCEGGGNDSSVTDYCVKDPDVVEPTKAPSEAPTEAPTVSPAPTKTPTMKPSKTPTSVPTVTPSQIPTSQPSYAPFGRLEYVGNEGTFYTAYPMGMCKGDCDSDDDCAAGLYCHQRNSYGAVPYCDGGVGESSTADFCSWDGTGEAPVVVGSPPEGYFKLKLYWEEGFRWQNETFEREWCMMYNYEGYPGTGLCWHGDYDEKCDESSVYVGKCIDDPRMWFTFVNVTSTKKEDPVVLEYLIMTGDDQRCFERSYRSISLERCDEDNSRQRWFAPNGDFYGESFEISQLGYTNQVVTNDHHPKSGELVELHDGAASRANDSQTALWERAF